MSAKEARNRKRSEKSLIRVPGGFRAIGAGPAHGARVRQPSEEFRQLSLRFRTQPERSPLRSLQRVSDTSDQPLEYSLVRDNELCHVNPGWPELGWIGVQCPDKMLEKVGGNTMLRVLPLHVFL